MFLVHNVYFLGESMRLLYLPVLSFSLISCSDSGFISKRSSTEILTRNQAEAGVDSPVNNTNIIDSRAEEEEEEDSKHESCRNRKKDHDDDYYDDDYDDGRRSARESGRSASAELDEEGGVNRDRSKKCSDHNDKSDD
jgi:hypothetical protein